MGNTACFRGGPLSAFWHHDQQTSFHNRFTVTLDHRVDGRMLGEAWEATKEVYPLIDCVPRAENREIVFYPGEGENEPILSEAPVRPGSELCGKRAFALSYYERSITMVAYHSVVDGGGIKMIFSTLLFEYLALYTGTRDEHPPVETRTRRSPETYYQSLAGTQVDEFELQPLMTHPRRQGMFCDVSMEGSEGDPKIARIKFSKAEFIPAIKAIGANPSAMLCILMAKAAYALHPTKRGNLSFSLTMSARVVFDKSDSIANFSISLNLPVEYEDVAGDDLPSVARKVRAAINKQRSLDYIMTQAAFCETYDWIMGASFSELTYMGTLDIGANTCHIVDFEMTDQRKSSVFLMELNDEFIMSFELGDPSDVYMQTVVNILGDFGVAAELVAPAHTVLSEITEMQND
ncbi:MAG: hypothetical protein Q4B54_06440 [Coriobacteriales bacterium]|nr:hypothetical protein [Coriobacteriales bacterium]